MKTTIFKSTIVIAAVLALFSCQKQDWTYKGPQYFEFSAFENGQTANNGIYTKENGDIGIDKVCVQLVKHSDAPVTVAFKIVPEVYYLKDESVLVSEVPAGKPADQVEVLPSTAEYGTDYEIVNGSGCTFNVSSMSGTLTIPAGEYFGYINVDMKVKSGNNFYIVLVDSPDTKANKPSSILNYVMMPEKIVYFEADGNYTSIVMVNKLRASIGMNLGEMERTLAAQIGEESRHFMRIGKRFIINMQYIYSINVLKQQLILSDYDHFAFQINISKDALKKMKELMLVTQANK